MGDLSAILLPLFQTPEFQETLKAVVKQALKEVPPPVDPPFILHTRREACERLRISLPTLEKALKEGRIKAQRIGYRILISEDELLKCLTSMRRV